MDSTRHTCLKLQIPQNPQLIFIKGTWFPSHFHLSITDGLDAWTCNASEEEVNERASNWDQPVSEYIDMSERYLGFQQPGSVYGFADAGGGFKRLSWTFEKEGTKLEWRWKFKPAENTKKITAGILDFLMDSNIRLSEEVVMKTKSNEKLKAEAEKCLEQSEKLQNEKAEFETKIYTKFLGVLNSKKAKLRELRDRVSSDLAKSHDNEEESSQKTETYDGDSEDEEDTTMDITSTSKGATRGQKRKSFLTSSSTTIFRQTVDASSNNSNMHPSEICADVDIATGEPGNFVPRFDLTGSSHGGRPEKFSHYVARQLGFKDENECPELSKLASEYARSSKAFDDNMYVYFSNEKEVESLCEKLDEELERCILGYFAFHWSHASLMITQVLSNGSNERRLKNMMLSATRKQRFERVTKDLKMTRAFSTIMEEMKVIGSHSFKRGDANDAFTEVLEPVAHCDRSPVLLFMGGGMGAGKSTVLKEILKEAFWSSAEKNAVVVEADAFKETDVIYQALNSKGHHNDMLQTAELVHQTSTDAASGVLVTALNEGRDVIMDGTLSWEPFVEQTIAMARTIHKHRYRLGVGYKVSKDGTITENYWEKMEDVVKTKKPYRIELVGVVCDPFLAVTRGIRRAIAVKRAVRVNSQLKSHKRFANAFPKYCRLVDNARLYCTNGIGVPPTLIGFKDGNSNLLVDRDQIKCLEILSEINDEADSIYELYADIKMVTGNDSVWRELILKPERIESQRDLKVVIERIEKSTP
ncbi:hypothetical protein SSX86_012303 [Deinandra increscens subsp. villosa]|uniref:Zeta toxin domain-containing protein n=1 Tax=Deinandra increscens subsp. villosa TaxID=3103831 RepID=A0AAP0D951_9ASTR